MSHGANVDLNTSAVFLRDDDTGTFVYKTDELASCTIEGDRVAIVFAGNGRVYRFSRDRVSVHPVKGVQLPAGQLPVVGGRAIHQPTGLAFFVDPHGRRWNKIFYQTNAHDNRAITNLEHNIRWIPADTMPQPGGVLQYWDKFVAALPSNDPIRRNYPLGPIYPNSALGLYVNGINPQLRHWSRPVIYPFNSNLSQRQAVEHALTSPLSVIQGPPGTGKTETILNVVANVVANGNNVGIVSSNNAAVDNVHAKLASRGLGLLAAQLGNKARKETFFNQKNQSLRNTAVRAFPQVQWPDTKIFLAVDQQLKHLQQAQRERAEVAERLRRYELEQRHFQEHLACQQLPDLGTLPLLKKSSNVIIRYLAESTLSGETSSGFLKRLVRYFRYGSTSGLDPSDADVLLRLQEAFFHRRTDELRQQLKAKERTIQSLGGKNVPAQHRQLSEQVLQAAIASRLTETTFSKYDLRKRTSFSRFVGNYPVILSSCHSLPWSVADGFMLDYLIIDEASQVAPMVAAVAMARAHNVVIVGDSRQLEPVIKDADSSITAPSTHYDCLQNSILTSILGLYGSAVPQTLLREHYRCHPAIIGFCNKKFYGGQLMPFTNANANDSDVSPMTLWRTSPGNHMRKHNKALGGGISNRREAEAVVEEVVQQLGDEFDADEIGVVTPYRKQVEKIGEVMDDCDVDIEADTVHSYQGRQQRAIILSTVVDQTKEGNQALQFAEKDQLVNVAVSRAAERFVMVIDHSMLPKSRLLNDLAGYIAYQNPDEPHENSSIVSVFDLLYSEYSSTLDDLVSRLDNLSKYRSESIISTVLGHILKELEFDGLSVVRQVHLAALFTDRSSMTSRERSFVRAASSVDFLVLNKLTNRPILAVEVDGFKHHENDPKQLQRDAVKDGLFKKFGLDLLRLQTTGSREPERIRHAIRAAL